jgi:amidase
MNALCSVSATGLAHLIRQREVSSFDVVDAYLGRIDDVNPRLNAVVQIAPDARERARAADAAIAHGGDVGPLHGVPFTVKDWIETEGLICAAGFAERSQFVPKRDATVVARIRAAGAILLGKTNVNDGTPVYSRPNNPYDLARSPGGSSSGEAVIIAAGGSPLGLGSDSGGSIRLPAAWCGVAGLRPTSGLVPNTGHFPRIGSMHDPRTTIGPIARRVEDLTLALRIIAGADGRDPGVVPMALGDPSSVNVGSLRVAWYTGMPGAESSPAVVSAVHAAASALRQAGAAVQEGEPPRLEESMPITVAYWSRVQSTSLTEWAPYRPGTLTAEEIERSIFEWERFRASMLRFMDGYDVIVCPAAAGVAPEHRALTGEDYVFMLPYSLTGYPVVAVRVADAEGMPVSVQVIARPWHDHVVLAAAQRIEEALGGWLAPALERLTD